MGMAKKRYVIRRESNVVRVDFGREPDPPTPKFPGANGLRLVKMEDCEPLELSVA
jgi:hypothetical protein